MGLLDSNAFLVDLLSRSQLPRPLCEQVAAILAKAEVVYRHYPAWPIPELAKRSMAALGASDELANGLAVASLLFYCASDVIDDAQDQDLGAIPDWRWEWPHAINTGNLFIFLSQEALLSLPAPEPVRLAWSHSLAAAGRQLSCGQALDLEAHAWAGWSEEEVLNVTRLKAGAAFGCMASFAPLWAERPDVAHWRAMGECLGMAFQLASDIRPYLQAGSHPDLAMGKLTLPLQAALEAEPALAAFFEAGRPLSAVEQQALREAAMACGAILYAQMRVDILKREAEQWLRAIGVDALSEKLHPLFHLLSFSQPPLAGA